MKKSTREIVALLLVIVLGAAAAGAMGWYIFVGHNWNVAATTIDDTIGEMEGYTVVVFDGQSLRETARNRLSDLQPLLVDENRGPSKPAEEEPEDEPVKASEVASSYRQKAATVFIMHVEDADAYVEPVVLSRNGKLLGVLSVDGTMTRAQVRKGAAQLKNRGVDYVVALVPDARILDDPVGEVDIVICNADEGISESGRYEGNMFCVDSPYIGQVQALIVSPSNVLSSKTVTSL